MKISNNTLFKKTFLKKLVIFQFIKILGFLFNNFAKAFQIIHLKKTEKSEKSIISYM